MFSSALLLSTRAGFSALRSNPMRTSLSALGVIIGVGAIISVLALSDGFERNLRAQIAKDGRLQTILVAPLTVDVVDGQSIPRLNFRNFTVGDAAALAESLGGSADVFMGVSVRTLVSLESRGTPRGAALAGTLANGLLRRNLRVETGRFFTEVELRDSARVAVVSQPLAAALAGAAVPATVVGRSVSMNGEAWKVVGVVAPESLPPTDANRRLSLFVPLTSARVVFGAAAQPVPPSMVIVARKVEDVGAVRRNVELWLASRFPKWREEVSVSSYQHEGDQARTGLMLFKLLMGAITGVSLVVGGIGIMNVLLASVTERTREIGVRKATGARNRDVLAQFLAESVAIAGIGGMLGTVLGVAVAVAVAAVMRSRTGADIHAGFSIGTLAVAVAAPLVVGLVFGTYPALRAARLSPIDAIRHE